ncbi:MAG: adenylate kinase [Clostridia bacterium]|nr:adenylate kinase [Clostridia bacterium]
MRMILLGPPGAGKGTQAANLSMALKVPHISTGDIFRANIKEGTPLGVLAKSFIDAGKLVPDDVTIGIVELRLAQEDCKNGFIMDGFPRTIVQAEMFEKMLAKQHTGVKLVANIFVPDELIIKRMSGRRMCTCGRTYHIENNLPKVEGICDACGKPLYIRDDDREETVIQRLKTYDEQTSPLVEYYRREGLLKDFDGTKPIQVTTQEILDEMK